MSLYEALARKTRRPSDGEDIWRRLQERLNPANYRPQRDPDVESFMVADPGRPPYEVIGEGERGIDLARPFREQRDRPVILNG